MMHPTTPEIAPCPGFTKALGPDRHLRYPDVSPDVLANETAREWADQSVVAGWWDGYLRRVLPSAATLVSAQR